MNVGVAALGDVSTTDCWSGIPYHFWLAARQAWVDVNPWRLDLSCLRWPRLVWNGLQCLSGNAGGFQYSTRCLDILEDQVPGERWRQEIITFNQHFPRASTVLSRGGKFNHYVDAPFVALVTGRGLDLQLPKKVVKEAIALERENYAASKRVITMGRWAAEAMVKECNVSADKVHVILPGANLIIPNDWFGEEPVGQAGVDRPFTLGFIGKDWKRKGLPMLCELQKRLTHRGWKCRVLAVGNAPKDLQSKDGVEFAGFIDKSYGAEKILRFLSQCDLGCLFSEHEALGISTLEFLRAGVPVAGFAHEGPADTIPPDAGFRFPLGAKAIDIADQLDDYLRNVDEQKRFRKNALKWSKLVTWERCVREFQELWETGSVANPVQPWMGLDRPQKSNADR